MQRFFYMKKLILLSMIILFLQSCSLLHFFSVSEKNNEQIEEINSYLLNLSVDTTYSFKINPLYVDSLSTQKFAINTYKLKNKVPASPVQLRMYNNKGEFLFGWEQCFGDLQRLGILDSLPFKNIEHLPINRQLSFDNDLEIINNTNDYKELLIKQNKIYDFTIIVYWTIWTGWYSKSTFKQINEYLKKHPDYTFLIIKINTSY